MKVTGIIAEFDPFHNGHSYLIEKARQETGSDYIIIIMSGDYTQRGNPAIADKYTRAHMAASQGADIVLELPSYYSLGSAEYFAGGAVSILNSLGVVDRLFFGSECGNIEGIQNISEILAKEPVEYKKLLSEYMKKGMNFPASRQQALNDISNQSQVMDSSILESPNNTLGIEYVKMLIRSNSSIKPCTTKRTGRGHDNNDLSGNPCQPAGYFKADKPALFCSSSFIRNAILEKEIAKDKVSFYTLLQPYMPSSCISLLYDQMSSQSRGSSMSEYFSSLLGYRLIMERDSDFTRYADISQDISDKINNKIYDLKDFDSFAKSLKSRDLTYSRIQRMLMHIILNITAENMAEYKADGYTAYARLLSYNSSSKKLMDNIKRNSEIPVISTLSDADRQISGLPLRLLNEDIRCSELYDTAAGCKIIGEYRKKPVII